MKQILVWIYARLLSLYPQQYRAEYGEELQAVFNLLVNEAAQNGFLLLTIIPGEP